MDVTLTAFICSSHRRLGLTYRTTTLTIVSVRLAQRGVKRSDGIAASQLSSGKRVGASEVVNLIPDPPPLTGLLSPY